MNTGTQVEKIQTLDMEPIMFKLITSKGWTVEEAADGVKEYKRFLILIAKYGDTVARQGMGVAPFSDAVDEVWHTHILDTQKYIEDCNAIFGSYIHHYPYSGVLDEEDKLIQRQRLANTVRLYADEFGQPPMRSKDLECDQCDNCHQGECGKPCEYPMVSLSRRRPTLADLQTSSN
jgi:hypothetical protein